MLVLQSAHPTGRLNNEYDPRGCYYDDYKPRADVASYLELCAPITLTSEVLGSGACLRSASLTSKVQGIENIPFILRRFVALARVSRRE